MQLTSRQAEQLAAPLVAICVHAFTEAGHVLATVPATVARNAVLGLTQSGLPQTAPGFARYWTAWQDGGVLARAFDRLWAARQAQDALQRLQGGAPMPE